jgi:hypothetical protein
MLARTVILGATALALLGCEPMDMSVDGSAPAATQSAASGTSMPEGLTAEQRSIWNTFSDKGKATVNACMAEGKSFRACTAI